MKQLPRIPVLLCLILFISAFELKADFVVLKNLDSGQKSKAPMKLKFFKNSENAEALYALTRVPVGGDEQVEAVEGDNVYYDPKWQPKNGKIYLGLGSLLSRFTVILKSGRRIRFASRVKMSKTKVIEKKCEKEKLEIDLPNYKGPGVFIGVKCSVVESDRRVHVSVPGEMELNSSSVFEVAGKGERWKSFDSKQIAGANESTAFLKYQLKKWALSLNIKTKIGETQEIKVVIEQQEAPYELHFGLGGGQIGYKTVLNEESSTSPFIHGLVTTKPYLWNIIGRAEVNFVMPLSGLQFYSFNIGTGPYFRFGNSAVGLFVEYLTLGVDASETSTSFSHSHAGAGLEILVGLGERSWLGLYGNYNGVGGDSTHTGGKLFVKFKSTSGSFWGGFVSMGMQTATSKITNNDTDFSQMLGGITYGF